MLSTPLCTEAKPVMQRNTYVSFAYFAGMPTRTTGDLAKVMPSSSQSRGGDR